MKRKFYDLQTKSKTSRITSTNWNIGYFPSAMNTQCKTMKWRIRSDSCRRGLTRWKWITLRRLRSLRRRRKSWSWRMNKSCSWKLSYRFWSRTRTPSTMRFRSKARICVGRSTRWEWLRKNSKTKMRDWTSNWLIRDPSSRRWLMKMTHFRTKFSS